MYVETRRALNDARTARGVSNGATLPRLPEWVKLVIATATILVSLTLAWAALDKRIDLVNQKLDLKLDGIFQQLQRLEERPR
jgi:hypothetical protein